MNWIFGFSLETIAGMMLVAIIYGVSVHAPLIFAGFVALRRGTAMRRRLLFVVTASTLSYGFLLLLFLAVWIPVSAVMVFVIPTLRFNGYFEPALFTAVAEFMFTYWQLLLPLAIAVEAWLVVRYLAPRWNRVADALSGAREDSVA